MRRVLGYLRDVVLTFLPHDYRPEWAPPERDLVGPCMAGGAVLSFVCVIPLAGGYFDFIHEAFDRIVAGPDLLENPDLLNSGVMYYFEYLFRPSSFFLFYFFVENVFRTFFAGTVGQVYGTLPLHIVNWGHRLVSPHYEEWAMGPRVIDRVKKVEGKPYDLLVGTCRRKPTWDTYNTISYEGELYEVLKEVDSHPPYRFLYELRKNPKWRVTRKIHEYDPRETLEKSS